MSLSSADWWRQAVVYQVYPRTFRDADGNGFGDFRGVTAEADYLAGLGIDAVWLSPFYPSELADGGYDVADYRDVDPRIGTLEEFDEMVRALHERNLRVFIDIVPNHSSDQHPWFRAALEAGPGSPERERYIFRDGSGPHGDAPPNDWPSHWGPSCWSRTPDGQWYLHLFAPEQPDFNWDHPEVRADFLNTLRFWCDRGVDGFRIDVAHGLVKDLSEPYPRVTSMHTKYIPDDGSHPLFDRDALQDVYRDWRGIFDAYTPARVAVGEVGAPLSRRHLYTAKTSLHQAFNFELLDTPWDRDAIRNVIDETLRFAAVSQSSSTWVLSNHDVVRHASRYGLPNGTDLNAWLLSQGAEPALNTSLGTARARAMTMLISALPGSVYLYQGEELGLFEVADLPTSLLQDPIWERSNHQTKGRDGCRVPLPWIADAPSFGFGDGSKQLPQPQWFREFAVDKQAKDNGSMLNFYRRLLEVRRTLLTTEALEWIDAEDSLLHFRRPNGWECVVNFGSGPALLPPGDLRIASTDISDGRLPENAAAWLIR